MDRVGPPVGLTIDSYYLAACSLPLEACPHDGELRGKIFRDVSRCEVVSPIEICGWLGGVVLHGDWEPLVATCCRALWLASNKRDEKYSSETRFVHERDLRTLFVTLQRLTELYVKVGAASPTEPRFLSFSEFQNLIALLSDWGYYMEDPYDTFREAGATDTPGGSLLSLSNLATYCLEHCTVHIPNTGLPEEDWVILAPAAIVRETRSLTSPEVCGEIVEGTIVRVVDIVGRRALLSRPVKGWVSLKTRRGQDILEPFDKEEAPQPETWQLRSPSHIDSLEPEPLPHDSVPLPSAYPEEEPTFSFVEIPSPSVAPPVPSPRRPIPPPNELIVRHSNMPLPSTEVPVPREVPVRDAAPLPVREATVTVREVPAPIMEIPRPTGSAHTSVERVERMQVQTTMLLRRGSGSDSCSGRGFSPPSRTASGNLHFTKPTQSVCMKIRNPQSGQADFKKYPWDFTGECQPLPTAKPRKDRKEPTKYAFGKQVQRAAVSSAAFKSTTPRNIKVGHTESGDIGPGAYQPDSRHKKVHTRSNSQGAGFTSSRRDLLKVMTGGKVRDGGREGRAREPTIAIGRSNTPSYMQPLRREVDEVKKRERGHSARRTPSARRQGGPGFGSSVKRELPLTRRQGDTM